MYKSFLLFATLVISYTAITHSVEEKNVLTGITLFHSFQEMGDTPDHTNHTIPLSEHGEIEEDFNDEDVAKTAYYILPSRPDSQSSFYTADQLVIHLFHPEAFIPPPRLI